MAKVILRNFSESPKWQKSACGIFPKAQNGQSHPSRFSRKPKMAKVILRNFFESLKIAKKRQIIDLRMSFLLLAYLATLNTARHRGYRFAIRRAGLCYLPAANTHRLHLWYDVSL